MSTAIRATGLSAADRRVRGSLDFLPLRGDSDFSDLSRSGGLIPSRAGMSGSSPTAPSLRQSAITPSYQMRTPNTSATRSCGALKTSAPETRAAGHGEPQLPVPGRARACHPAPPGTGWLSHPRVLPPGQRLLSANQVVEVTGAKRAHHRTDSGRRVDEGRALRVARVPHRPRSRI